ncbi:MAG: biopolymer transporter ExbD [Acidobacteria bacterium]|nr:biopolymer transporter ExbD [Acidobacteriota bacterium]
MGFSIDSSSGSRRNRRYGGTTLSEMNVVPLVDVVLVLLIIFMLTAQAMQFGLEIEVPKVKTEKASAQDLNVVNITKTGELYFNDKPVNINELAAMVKANKKVKENLVFIRADKATTYDPIAKVVAELTDAKIGVRLVTQTDDSRPRRR